MDASGFAGPAGAGALATSTFSVLPKWFSSSAVFLLALAMVLALCAEAVRAAIREHPLFCLPALLGFLPALAAMSSVNRWRSFLSRLLHHHFFLPALFVVPFILQLVVLAVVRTSPASDWANYWYSARQLRETGAYVYPVQGGLEFRAYKPPGMAVYLALVQAALSDSVLVAQVVNAVLLAGGNIIFYFIVRGRLARRAAILATAVFALWPSRVLSSALLSYDAPGSFFVLLFWFFADGRRSERWYVALLSGVLGGLATMFRQPLLLLPFALLAAKFITGTERRAWCRRALMFVLGMSAVIGPWTYRNHRVLGSTVMTSTMGGPSLYRSFHPQAGRYYTNVGWEQLLADSGGDEAELNKLAWRHGLGFIAADPAGSMLRVLRNWHRLFESDHEIAGLVFDTPRGPLDRRTYRLLRSAACGISDAWYAFVALTTLIATAIVLRRRTPLPDLLWPILAIASGVAIHGLFESQPRYFVIYHCFWAMLIAAVWHTRLESDRATAQLAD